MCVYMMIHAGHTRWEEWKACRIQKRVREESWDSITLQMRILFLFLNKKRKEKTERKKKKR